MFAMIPSIIYTLINATKIQIQILLKSNNKECTQTKGLKKNITTLDSPTILSADQAWREAKLHMWQREQT